jgi:hypothetical protein
MPSYPPNLAKSGIFNQQDQDGPGRYYKPEQFPSIDNPATCPNADVWSRLVEDVQNVLEPDTLLEPNHYSQYDDSQDSAEEQEELREQEEELGEQEQQQEQQEQQESSDEKHQENDHQDEGPHLADSRQEDWDAAHHDPPKGGKGLMTTKLKLVPVHSQRSVPRLARLMGEDLFADILPTYPWNLGQEQEGGKQAPRTLYSQGNLNAEQVPETSVDEDTPCEALREDQKEYEKKDPEQSPPAADALATQAVRVPAVRPQPPQVPDARALLLFLRRYSPDIGLDLSLLDEKRREWLHLFSVDAIHSMDRHQKKKQEKPADRRSKVIAETRSQRDYHLLGVANNFVKHCLFRHFKGCRYGLDLGCNRGQDVFKWRGLHPSGGVVFLDLLPLCLWITESRWKDAAYDFPASFVQADFCASPDTLANRAIYLHALDRQRAKGEMRRPALHSQLRLAPGTFDCISSQFAPIMACASLDQLRGFFAFCAWHLSTKGKLVISLTDGDYLQHCFRQAYHRQRRLAQPTDVLEVDVGYAVVRTRLVDDEGEPLSTVHFLGSNPTFANGHRYEFTLPSDLTIEEYLVQPTEVIDQAEKAGLQVLNSSSFSELFFEEVHQPHNANILQRMKLDPQDLPANIHANLKLYRSFVFTHGEPAAKQPNLSSSAQTN